MSINATTICNVSTDVRNSHCRILKETFNPMNATGRKHIICRDLHKLSNLKSFSTSTLAYPLWMCNRITSQLLYEWLMVGIKDVPAIVHAGVIPWFRVFSPFRTSQLYSVQCTIYRACHSCSAHLWLTTCPMRSVSQIEYHPFDQREQSSGERRVAIDTIPIYMQYTRVFAVE